MSATTQLSAHVSHRQGDVLIIAQSYTSSSGTNTEFVYDQDLSIPALMTDFQLPFGTINTARAVVIQTDKPINVKLNYTGNTPFYITGLCMITTEATAIFISNTANEAATVKVVVLGD